MKHLLICIAFLSYASFNFAQEELSPKALTIQLPLNKIKKGLSKEIAIPLVHRTVDTIDIKAEFWDTTVYNPYKNHSIELPIQLTFIDSTYASPIPRKKVITSRYGWRKGRPHKGIDIDLVTGDSVVSILDGIVRFAKYSSGHGNTVVVKHYNGLETTYAHLSHIAVKPNDSLSKGQYLGKGGNTGNSRGSHLHLVASYKGEEIHPEYLFDFSESNAIRAQNIWVTHKWTRPIYHNSRRLTQVNLLTTEEEALASLEKQRKVYVVRRGDTLSQISRRNNLSIASICRTNAIKSSSTLKVGQKLVLEL